MQSAADAMRRHLQIGLGLVALLGGTVTAWSLTAQLEGAVVTQGFIVVESNIKKVQHPTGGVVGELRVKEGQLVKEGEIVVRLDETIVRSNLGVILNEYNAQRLRVARLSAERDGKKDLTVPADLVARAAKEPEIQLLIDGERQLFHSHVTTRGGQKAQFLERIGQLRQEIKGSDEQKKSMDTQLVVARNELKGLRELEAKRLVPKPRISALEREVAQREGSLGESLARISQAQGKITETELQILQLEKDMASEVGKDLREADTRIGELIEKRAAAEDQLKRIDIRAPISGIVHQLSVHTVGGVVNQTEPLMLIVPAGDRLIVEVRIQPQDIDQVRLGQETRVRFSAFNQRTTPEVMGTLFRLGGDLTRDPQTGQPYFTGGVSITDKELARLQGLKLLPGMPADAYIKTSERTFASYLVKPLTDQMDRALRER